MTRAPRLGGLIAAALLAAGCGSGTIVGHDTYEVGVDVVVEAAGVRIINVGAASAAPAARMTTERALSYELVTDTGTVFASGRLNDPRDIRTEWHENGLLRQSQSRADFGALRLRLPRVAGDLIVRDEQSGAELGRTRFTPNMAASAMIKLPDDLRGARTLVAGNGDLKKGIDLIIVGEGFTEAELPAYRDAVAKLVAKLKDDPAFKARYDRFNFWRQDVVSRTSGIPVGATANDTAFEMAWSDATTRCPYFVKSAGFEAAQKAAGTDADLTVVLVNSTRYGGCGPRAMLITTLVSDDHATSVFVHEIGHALFNLADEYAYPADEATYCHPGLRAANISSSARREDLPWRDLVADDTPLPTPPAQQDRVGAHEGAGYCTKGVYRPQPNCLMRNLGTPFCKVCQREIDAFFAKLDAASGGGTTDDGGYAGGGAAPGCSPAWYDDGICDPCLGDDPDCQTTAGGGTTACAAAGCDDCNARAGCGWCASAGACGPGDASGAVGGGCGDWRWLPSECSLTDPCARASACDACVALPEGCGWCAATGTCASPANGGACADWRSDGAACAAADLCGGMTTCDACAASFACGWCAASGTCMEGTGAGPTAGACSDWRGYTSQCATADPCALSWTCGDCTAAYGCGWCADWGGCVEGSSTGPATGGCGDWRWTSDVCAPPADPCAAYTDCATCDGYNGCGWCATDGLCVSGDTAGPTTGTCGTWQWLSTACL
ncbi:MAG TPA: M64 family metallopeptidase [Polyangia bacterium]|jgi:hypothetical protein